MSIGPNVSSISDAAASTRTQLATSAWIAWYAPDEKVYLNSRFNHHRPELPDYIAARGALMVYFTPGEPPNQSPTQPRRPAGDDDDFWFRHASPRTQRAVIPVRRRFAVGGPRAERRSWLLFSV